MAAHSYLERSQPAKSRGPRKRIEPARQSLCQSGLHLQRTLGNQRVYQALESGALWRLYAAGRGPDQPATINPGKGLAISRSGDMIARQDYRTPPPCTTVYCALLPYLEECERCCHETVPADDPQRCMGECLFSCNSLPRKVAEVASEAALGAAIGIALGGLLGFAVGGPAGALGGAALGGLLLGAPKTSSTPEA